MPPARVADLLRGALFACSLAGGVIAAATALADDPSGNSAPPQPVLALAEKGDAHAQFRLGAMYASGHGAPKDYKKAMQWYRRAAAQGHAKAQLSLGVLYQKGVSIRYGYTEAIRMYRAAAEQDDDAAQFNLGMMYVRGHGVLQDFVQGYKWFHLSARQGNVAARRNLERVKQLMDPEEIEAAKRLAGSWRPKR
jgi:TPR repeat protein